MKTNDILAILPSHFQGLLEQQPKAEGMLARMSPEQKQAISEEMEDWHDLQKQSIRQYLSLVFNQRQPMTVEDGIAKIHVKGFLASGLSFIQSCLEASDYNDIQAELKEAKTNPDIRGIMLNIDSPGGSVVGCYETAQLVKSIEKPRTAFIPGLGGSAAYFIASGADQIYTQESALVGSIGTIATFLDFAGMLEKNGITPHIFTSPNADQKAAGNPYRRPTEAETESMQSMVEEYGEQFLSFVTGEREVEPEVLRGNAVSGRLATITGLADGIATEAEVLEELKAIS